jgi:hypothetical protein
MSGERGRGRMSIPELIDQAVEIKSIFDPERRFLHVLPPTPLGQGVPTLAKGIYRPFTAQLKARFEHIGRWEFGTHGDWLGLEDMERLWVPDPDDDWSKRIFLSFKAAEEEWENDAAALFRPDRLTPFSTDTTGNDHCYLLWFDCEDEPELWAYGSNGELRFIDLAEYLTAYVNRNAYQHFRPWRLAER